MIIPFTVENYCPHCRTSIQPEEQVTICSRCGTTHHAACWQENHGCTTLGCQGSPLVAQQAIPQPSPPEEPAAHRACPTCGYLMKPTDITCPCCAYVNNLLPPATPPPVALPQTIPPPPVPGYFPQSSQTAFPQGYLPEELPPEMRRWNWGAFFLTLFWAPAMNQWIWFVLCLIPYVSVVPMIYLAIKGNELSWQSRRWESLEQFNATQEVWKKWALGLFYAWLGLLIIFGIIIVIIAVSAPSFYPS